MSMLLHHRPGHPRWNWVCEVCAAKAQTGEIAPRPECPRHGPVMRLDPAKHPGLR